MKKLDFAKDLINFIDESPTNFHLVENVKNILLENDFRELKPTERWDIEKNKKYFTIKNDSSIVAFVPGNGDLEKEGFKLIGSHTDFPNFKIKPKAEILAEKTYLKLNTEVYGGPILNTWLDRPLSIAGKVVIKSEDVFNPISKIIDLKKPLLIIPNIAIHMNRKVNEGIALSKQKDMLPLVAIVNEEFEKEDFLINMLAKELDVDKEDILDFELSLYESEAGKIIGMNDELISVGRLDNMAMVHASLHALINSKQAEATKVMVCFDNEEVGSGTKQGADSPMLRTILERISMSLGNDRENFYRSLYNSYIISADMAHAVHPNSPEIHDPTNRPVINGGPAVKLSASQSYTTDSDSHSVYKALCQSVDIPVQTFVNESDQRGGSTIGPINSSQLDIRSIDIGNPILAMHSIRELGGVEDHYNVKKSFEEFFR